MRIVFTRCLAQSVAPFLLASAVAAVGAATTAAMGTAAIGGAGALAPWLHLPAFVATAVACGAAVECWPTFAQRRPGADWVLRLTGAPLFGCGAAMAGALLALAVWLLLLGAIAAPLLPVPRAHRVLAPATRPLLTTASPVLRFHAGGADGSEIQLRPEALLPAGAPQPATLQLSADGEALLPEPFAIEETGQLVRVPFGPRPVHELELRVVAGNLPLLFPPGSVVLVEAAGHSRLGNGVVGFLLWLLPAAVALALAALAAPAVAFPVNLTLVLAALLLQTLGNLGPVGDGIAALLRGRWLPAEPLFRASLPSLGTGVLAMILAMAARRRLMR